ncbi:MAG: DUF1549 domain-containing protein, partial [Planctomycetia bacterium]
QRWIELGAKTARPEPDDPNQARFTEEELSHWAWRPVGRPMVPALPTADNPVDAFLLAKLKEKGVDVFSTSVERRTLIRRATFDLVGLPPTPREVEEFVADPAPDAYEKLLDRLLATPQYGERWGRHWLDVAGYAETDGAPGADVERPHAWRYRDYVVRGFNDDKPYDEFLREQIAGDELAAGSKDFADPTTLDRLAALGFLRMAPDATQTANTIVERNQAAADSLKVTTSAFLGLSVGCAQCHDHKYDPIPTEDYYRLRAFFDPAFDLKAWKTPQERLLDVTPKAVVDEVAAASKEVDRRADALNKAWDAAAKAIVDAEIARVPEAERPEVAKAYETEEGKRTPEQKALLEKHPKLKPVWVVRAFFNDYDAAGHAKFKEEEAAVAKLRERIPSRWFLMTV